MSIFHLKPLRGQTDEQLMARAAAGSDTAFEELYRRFARRLKGFFFLQLGGNEELAADATHDVFLRAYEARGRYQEGRRVDTWLFTIAYNICRNHYRSNAYEAQLLATLDAEPVGRSHIRPSFGTGVGGTTLAIAPNLLSTLSGRTDHPADC